MNIVHEPNKFLVVFAETPLLIEGTEGRVTATRNEFAWFDSRAEAVNACLAADADWVDPLASEEEVV